MFPNNIPLPPPETAAWMIGGSMHFLHFIARIMREPSVPEEEEEMYRESRPWFSWVCSRLFYSIYWKHSF
jgi:hypothetical protein